MNFRFILLFMAFGTGARAQLSGILDYRNMAGWGSSTEAGLEISITDHWSLNARGALIQETGIGENQRYLGVVTGFRYERSWAENYYFGSQLDVRFLDGNYNAKEQLLIAPSLYLGRHFAGFAVHANVGLPYLFGVGLSIPLKP
jgi:hypothetical protein